MTDEVMNTAKEKMAKSCASYEREMQSIRARSEEHTSELQSLI